MIFLMADLMEHFPQWFYKDAKISAAYGSFGNCIWSGGRTYLDRNDSKKMRKTIEELNKRGIAIRYTFTNPLLEEKHVYDTFSNLCLELADNGQNEVIVNSPILEQYIRENYPNFKLISSTTKCIDTIPGLVEELKKDYYIVVADSAWNNTPELFGVEDRGRVEVIVNHYCEDNCPRRRAHYDNIGKCNLTFTESDFPPCKNIGRTFYQLMKNKSFITTELLYGKYQEAGFQHFKVDGRSVSPSNVIESFVYYLVKPEFHNMVRQILFKEIYHM